MQFSLEKSCDVRPFTAWGATPSKEVDLCVAALLSAMFFSPVDLLA
jgi:hypothetical protein